MVEHKKHQVGCGGGPEGGWLDLKEAVRQKEAQDKQDAIDRGQVTADEDEWCDSTPFVAEPELTRRQKALSPDRRLGEHQLKRRKGMAKAVKAAVSKRAMPLVCVFSSMGFLSKLWERCLKFGNNIHGLRCSLAA